MVASGDAWPEPMVLANAIKHRIVQRTGKQIETLQVEVSNDRIVIRGRTATFHLKQLALQSVFDVIGSTSTTQIELDVQVD
jgi:hypothetical protein